MLLRATPLFCLFKYCAIVAARQGSAEALRRHAYAATIMLLCHAAAIAPAPRCIDDTITPMMPLACRRFVCFAATTITAEMMLPATPPDAARARCCYATLILSHCWCRC